MLSCISHNLFSFTVYTCTSKQAIVLHVMPDYRFSFNRHSSSLVSGRAPFFLCFVHYYNILNHTHPVLQFTDELGYTKHWSTSSSTTVYWRAEKHCYSISVCRLDVGRNSPGFASKNPPGHHCDSWSLLPTENQTLKLKFLIF